MSPRTAFAVFFFAVITGAAHADEPLVQDGSYAVTARLELPHLERWAIDRTATVCVANIEGADGIPLPVLSANNPFAGCSARNLRRDGASLRYDIQCSGRDAARGTASYELTPDGFRGRIAMVMGAKNMTMTEVQTGRRLGSCDMAGVRQD